MSFSAAYGIAWTAGLYWTMLCGVTITFFSIQTVANRKPGVGLWDAPARNPFYHIMIGSNLTEEGLKYRRWLFIAVAAFFMPMWVLFVIGGLSGELGRH